MEEKHSWLVQLLIGIFFAPNNPKGLEVIEQVNESPVRQLEIVSPEIIPNFQDPDIIRSLRPGRVHLHGWFTSLSGRYVRSGLHVLDGIFTDGESSVRVVWFNKPYLAPTINQDREYELIGNYELKRARFIISNPHIQPLLMGCFAVAPMNTNKMAPLIPKAVESPHSNIWTKDIYGKRLDPDSSWAKLRRKVFTRDNFTCVNCGAKLNLTVDHIKPKSLGGSNALSNLQTLCKDCHEDKHFSNFLDRKFDAVDDYGKNYVPTIKIKRLESALRNNEGLAIRYTDREGKKSLRVIHPHKIYKGYLYEGRVVYRRQVYVDVFCDLDKDNRTFRVSRMKLSNTMQNKYLI